MIVEHNFVEWESPSRLEKVELHSLGNLPYCVVCMLILPYPHIPSCSVHSPVLIVVRVLASWFVSVVNWFCSVRSFE